VRKDSADERFVSLNRAEVIVGDRTVVWGTDDWVVASLAGHAYMTYAHHLLRSGPTGVDIALPLGAVVAGIGLALLLFSGGEDESPDRGTTAAAVTLTPCVGRGFVGRRAWSHRGVLTRAASREGATTSTTSTTHVVGIPRSTTRAQSSSS